MWVFYLDMFQNDYSSPPERKKIRKNVHTISKYGFPYRFHRNNVAYLIEAETKIQVFLLLMAVTRLFAIALSLIHI